VTITVAGEPAGLIDAGAGAVVDGDGAPLELVTVAPVVGAEVVAGAKVVAGEVRAFDVLALVVPAAVGFTGAVALPQATSPQRDAKQAETTSKARGGHSRMTRCVGDIGTLQGGLRSDTPVAAGTRVNEWTRERNCGARDKRVVKDISMLFASCMRRTISVLYGISEKSSAGTGRNFRLRSVWRQ
jgi:hypothetical protein